ncbi:MAG TPA: restriction endonuclease subunit S [Planctomycetaceae bacterium]|nr:restriction endonuclease subunit S [Planctomycetaceae bacterium]
MKTRTVQLDDLVTIVGGGTPSKARPEYFLGHIPWVSPKDVKTWNIFDSQDHITEDAIDRSSTSLIDPGAVLVVIRSGVLKHTLPVAINRVAVTLNQDLKALVCGDRITARPVGSLV